MPLLREYLESYPEVRVRALLLDRPVNLTEEGLDLAVRLGPLQDSALLATRVGQVRLVVCAAPAYLKRRGIPQHPADLAHHRLVSSSPRWRFQERICPVAPHLLVNSNAAALDSALCGWGIIRLPSYQVVPHLEAGRLQPLLESYQPPPWPVHLLQSPSLRPLARVRLLHSHLVAGLRGHPWLDS
jgi:DNA-binding transcriptional LysR family regulator